MISNIQMPITLFDDKMKNIHHYVNPNTIFSYIHSTEPVYSCPDCHHKFKNVWLVDSQPELNASFKNYVATAEQNACHSDASWEDSRRYQCPKCFKTYAQKRTLDRHLKASFIVKFSTPQVRRYTKYKTTPTLTRMEWTSFLCENGPFHLSLAGPAIWSPVHHLKTTQIDTQDSFHSEPVLSPQHKQTEIFQCEDCVTRLLGQDVFSKRCTPKHASSTSKDVSFERQEPGPSVHKIHFGQDVDSISSKQPNGQPCPQKVRRIGGRKEVRGENEGRSGDSAGFTSYKVESSPLPLALRYIQAANFFSLLRSDKYGLPTSSPSCAQTHPGCQLFLPLALRRIRAANFFSLLLSDTSGLPTNSPSCAQIHPGCHLLLPLDLRHIRAANLFSRLRSDQSGLPTSSPSYAQTNPGCQLFLPLALKPIRLPTCFPLALRHIRAANLFSLLRPDTSGLPT
uniref:(California timema) hypothetical protein n=1 Tax=Timema californicum TaxID=61474 RepID=A0A7R9P365_TIMCA|nr:unnamed protein product [Timema californicum]